ncbi:MAG: dihydropteroate synthase [Thermoplasmata archaeon]
MPKASRRKASRERTATVHARVLEGGEGAVRSPRSGRAHPGTKSQLPWMTRSRPLLVQVGPVSAQASISVKRAMGSVGADAIRGTARTSAGASADQTILCGTAEQYRQVLPKLGQPPIDLPAIAKAVRDAVKNYSTHAPRKVPTLHRPLTVGDRSRVMGIVNITPDSFWDGGRFFDPDRALEQALTLQSEGADLIDIGGESTRPGAPSVSVKVEWQRVGPVIDALHDSLKVPISIDTRHAEIARQALEHGADLVNDVSALEESAMRRLIARTGAPAILMHMRGTPTTMQEQTQYSDVRGEVYRELAGTVHRAIADGVAEEQLLIDPGLGFSKTASQSLELLRHIGEFRSLGLPVVVGASRKSFLGWATGGLPLEARFEASLAAAVQLGLQGIEIVRVHDVAPTVRALRLVDALRTGAPVKPPMGS